MTDRLSPQREAEIRERAESASPSPWFLHEDWPGRVFSESQFNHHIARVTGSNPERNEAFIAHAREDVPALLAELAAVRAERDEAREQLAKYVGHEPTVAEEMAFLNRCLDAVYALCDEAGAKGITSGGMFTVDAVRDAADGVRPEGKQRPADAIQYGIRIPDGSVLNGTVTSLVEQQARLSRYRDTWPDAVLVQRTVIHGEWTEATS